MAFADCERHDDWFWQQDVNAWSSLAYVAAGAALLVAVVLGRLPRSFAALALVTGLEGVGSILYHGTGGELAQVLHDTSLLGILGFLAGWHLGRLGGGADKGALVGAVAGSVGGALQWALAPGATNVVVLGAVLLLLGAEVAGRRRGLEVIWDRRLLGLVALAAAAWAASSPSSPLCRQASLLQPHGAWHLLSAVIVLVWAARAASSTAQHGAPGIPGG